MINKIKKYVNKKRFLNYKWKNIGETSVGFNYSIISPECIMIGDNFYAEDNLRLQAWKIYGTQEFNPLIKIGRNVSMMENCQISCCKKVTIGDNCLFGANVFITDNFHGDNTKKQLDIPPINRPLNVRGEVHIGSNVLVGRNVCIMPGVTIGDCAVIGANAVVTHDIPAYAVAVGVPAKLIN